jgi:hypothetical protein
VMIKVYGCIRIYPLCGSLLCVFFVPCFFAIFCPTPGTFGAVQLNFSIDFPALHQSAEQFRKCKKWGGRVVEQCCRTSEQCSRELEGKKMYMEMYMDRSTLQFKTLQFKTLQFKTLQFKTEVESRFMRCVPPP